MIARSVNLNLKKSTMQANYFCHCYRILYTLVMAVALCLYGHFRSFDDCWMDLRDKLISPNNITEIFAMSWADSMGNFQHPDLASSPRTHPGYDPQSSEVSLTWLQLMLDRLRPTRIHLDNYYIHDLKFTQMVENLQQFNHPNSSHRPKGTLGQVWGRCASLAMAADYEQRCGQKFDRIVCTRWDIGYSEIIDLSRLDPQVVSMDGMYGPQVISDAWACGPSAAMSAWGQQFNSVPLLVANQTMSFGPHEWLQAHFDLKSIPWSNRPDLGIWIRR